MEDTSHPLALPASPIPQIARVTVPELVSALKAGIWDFRTAPLFGIAFSTFYVAAGLALWWLGAGTFLWTLAFALGFPLVAPFAAVGLYEVSRRIEAGEPLVWGPVLSVVWHERTRQLPWVGAILAFTFLFWSFFAHMTFALFMGLGAMHHGPLTLEAFMTPEGLTMLAVQGLVGAGVAFLTFGMTAVSLPLLVDREIDFVTAMIVSLNTVRHNRVVMGLWALTIAAGLLVAMLPAFLGLFVALPVFGHATWHLYRRALYTPAP
ncbi:DUF2189 domain-containing protein [Silicimonas algicola]|uniref:Putative membrane protein n=1 Tax=Silicimonas algicola TaxID=1826607 RepID=A0A316GPD0_9RHOB|nr:DUF2189 domain-containing protein [Silicimonas algicola]AZQ67150.1 DUF2189 domain-containing protein [Silicimonas algicola]PWK56797.1 putative membrane protein [Silicimonas algicola]